MKQSNTYYSIFAEAMNIYNDKLKTSVSFIVRAQEHGYFLSWDYISIIAGFLTAYNELNPLDFFVKLKHFQ